MKKFFISFLILIITIQIFAQDIPTQGYQYSSKPLNVMGFTGKSTISGVEQQLNNWKINYEFFDNPFIEDKRCKQLRCRNFRWKGILLSCVHFHFTKEGNLARIGFSPDEGESQDKIVSFFYEITSAYPQRKYFSKHDYYEISGRKWTENCTVKNGINDYESAVLTLYDTYYSKYYGIDFFFHGGQKEFFHVDSW